MQTDADSILRALEQKKLGPDDALPALARLANEAPAVALRLDACRVLGALAGRAFGASWEVAERSAFALLEIARAPDALEERVGLLRAMGRGFRNLWLMPYVHRRLYDEDEVVAAAAISAAGGLAFPALEGAIASFLDDDQSERRRLAAISALGRMGAESAATKLVALLGKSAPEAKAALSALTEIRSRAGVGAALDLLTRDAPREVVVAAVRYLSEVGEPGVLPTLRRLARNDDPELRIAARLAALALEAEKKSTADERILGALTESDRAVRASLARRLRTLPVAAVLEQAELLFLDEPHGVIQIVSEVRAPEVTRLLLRIARDESIDLAIRARAVGSIEADEEWEREALVALVKSDAPRADPAVRVAAARTIGAFAPLTFVLDHLSELAEDSAAIVRAALLWAMQLAARPDEMAAPERKRAEAIVRRLLADDDVLVRRRAAYVAGNLDAAALVPDLVELARRENDHANLRVAAFVALGEIASPARFADLVFLWNRETDAHALAATSRAIERSLLQGDDNPRSSEAPQSLTRVHDRLKKLLADDDAIIRAAAARVAGLSPGANAGPALAKLVEDVAPRVREQAVIALGRLGGVEHEDALLGALDDADPAIQARAAEALLQLGLPDATMRVVDFVSRTQDRTAALRLTLAIAPSDAILPALSDALGRVRDDDPIYEALLALKVSALEASRPTSVTSTDLDSTIAALFPMWTKLSAARGFAPLAKSLRTAEMLYGSIARGGDEDLAAAIVLWMKCLEGYLHAWLAPRLRTLQLSPHTLWDLTDKIMSSGWPAYQRWLSDRWSDPVAVGSLSVEVPLRSVPSVLREFQERRLKSIDSPASVTEWSRLMLFLAFDHPTGAKNILKVTATEPERGVRLAHRLMVLAQVRNAVTHRSVAGASTLEEFRRAYYGAFEDLCALA